MLPSAVIAAMGARFRIVTVTAAESAAATCKARNKQTPPSAKHARRVGSGVVMEPN